MASSYGWMFASNGDWSSLDNWKDVDLQTTGTLPTVADDAFIMGAAVVTIGAGESFQLLDLNLATYSQPTIGNPEVLLQSGTLVIGGDVNDNYTVSGYVPSEYVLGGGTPPISVSGGGTIALSGGSTLSIGGYIGTDIAINFADDNNNLLTLGGFAVDSGADAGTINGFVPGDTIDLSGVPSAGATETYDPAAHQITIGSNGQLAAQFTLTGAGYTSDNFDITDDGSGNAMLSVAPSAAQFYVDDTTTNTLTAQQGTVIAGEPSYLSGAYIYLGSDSVVVAATTPSVWIVGGSGDNAIVANGGTNILDGGVGGSKFLLGGDGPDTFWLRPTDTTSTWDTINNFHQGDLLAIWGWQTNTTTWTWTADQGSQGYTGETLHASLDGDGNINASVTFVGATSNDNLLMFQGPAGGIPYAFIYNAGPSS